MASLSSRNRRSNRGEDSQEQLGQQLERLMLHRHRRSKRQHLLHRNNNKLVEAVWVQMPNRSTCFPRGFLD